MYGLNESRIKKELEAKRREKRETRALLVFGFLAIGYFVGHYIVYLINN